MKYQLRDYQKQASDAAVRAFNGKAKRNGLLILPTGCHAKGTKILMYDGTFKNVEDILVGDVLVGDDGTPRNVLELHHGYDEMYRITPEKSDGFIVNGGHILPLYNPRTCKYKECLVRHTFVLKFLRLKGYKLYKIKKTHTGKPIDYRDFDVNKVGIGPYFGFTVDGNHLYLDSQFFVHHNSGKSLIIADIASRLDCPLLVFQPSKEILEQNFAKLQSYGVFDCGVYSASAGSKDINRITFATIGSVMNHVDDFASFRNILIDECHLTNAKGGQYKEFIEAQDRRVVGLTATPYRLGQGLYGMSMLKFLTRTRPRIFDDVLYYCQVSDLLAKGFLADLRYFDCTTLDMSNIKTNSTGADYDDESLKLEYERSGFYDQLTSTTMRVLKPKNGVPRNGVLVFTRFTKEADELVLKLRSVGVNAAIVTGNTKKAEREGVLDAFKRGDIKVVANVGVLTTGFDYPALDTVILARPTKSLSLYYQMVGRAIRPCAGKDGWVIDLGGNYKRFGKVSDLKIDVEVPGSARWCVKSNGKQLTNVMF